MMSLKSIILLTVLAVLVFGDMVLSVKINTLKLRKLNSSSFIRGSEYKRDESNENQNEDYKIHDGLKKNLDQKNKSQLLKGPIYVHNTRKGYYYIKACYIIDYNYVNTPEGTKNQIRTKLYNALGTQIEFLDWTFRSQDFDQDSVPDNIGIKLSEIIRLQYINLNKNKKINKLKLAQNLEEMFDLDCGVKLIVTKLLGQTFVYPHSLPQTDPKGCSACKNFNTSVMAVVDPDELLLQTDEKTRWNKNTLLFKHIRSLMYSLIHNDKKVAFGCYSNPSVSRKSGIRSKYDRSIQTLKFIDCVISNQSDGNCLQTVSARSCLKFEKEFSYCGNGIVDPFEECDCGSFMNCWRQNDCSCGPRNGHKPCAKLNKKDRQICNLIAHFQFHHHYEIVNHDNHYLFDTFMNFNLSEEYHTNFTKYAKTRNSVSRITRQLSKYIAIYLILLMYIN